MDGPNRAERDRDLLWNLGSINFLLTVIFNFLSSNRNNPYQEAQENGYAKGCKNILAQAWLAASLPSLLSYELDSAVALFCYILAFVFICLAKNMRPHLALGDLSLQAFGALKF